MHSILTWFHARPRRFLALAALAGLNLLAPPCLAEAPPMPAGMEQCDHGAPDQHAHCAEMQAADCETASDLNADGLRSAEAQGTGALLALLPPGEPRHATGAAATDPGGGAVRLHLLHCNLRN